jgi:type II secretory pathway component PulF
MLQSMHIETPVLTKFVFGVGHFATNPYILGALAVTATLCWTYREKFLTAERRLFLVRTLHLIPGVGPLMKATALARIASTLKIGLEVNLNLMRALTLALNSCGNPVYAATLNRILQSVRDGDPLAKAFGHFPALYPRMFCQSLETGEEAGTLTSSLQSTSAILKIEVDSRVETLGTIIEPLLLGCCAVFVGIFVLATFLPLQEFLSKLMT